MNDIQQDILSVFERNSHRGNRVKGIKGCFLRKNLYIVYCMQHKTEEVHEEFHTAIDALIEDGVLAEIVTESLNGEIEFTYVHRPV